MDKNYLDRYHTNTIRIGAPSTFSICVSEIIKNSGYILELGSRNGKESFYFTKN